MLLDLDGVDAEAKTVSACVHSLCLVRLGWVRLDRTSVFVEFFCVGFDVVLQKLLVFWG